MEAAELARPRVEGMMEVEVHGLVPDMVLPIAAPAATREHVPRGYGVQEQCLPFTAAASAGLLLRAPFSFGFCTPVSVPAGARPFAPPHQPRAESSEVFYVEDRPSSDFVGNAFRAAPIAYSDPEGHRHLHSAVHPGLSFFDRSDQADLFKVHLPFVLRTPDGVDSLFVPPVNRPALLEVVVGLVETDWYAHPVNLVVRLPSAGPVHVRAGSVLAQVVFVHRGARHAEISVVALGSRSSQPVQEGLLHWYAQHSQDRSAYKKLARSPHGRLEVVERTDDPPPTQQTEKDCPGVGTQYLGPVRSGP